MVTRKSTIAVLGAGNIGGTLGKKWHAAGHAVAFGVNNPGGQKAQAVRAALGETITIGEPPLALAENPEIVVLAVPGPSMEHIITTYAAQLDGRILIDTANRLGGGPLNSLALFQQHTPHASVYRAFNTLGWENFADPLFDGIPADLFYCGPDGESRPLVEQLIADVGLHAVYLGGNEQVPVVDALGSLWFALVFGQKHSRHLAFKMLTR